MLPDYVGMMGAVWDNTFPRIGCSNQTGYGGIYCNNGLLVPNESMRMRDCTDGPSNTIIVAEQSGINKALIHYHFGSVDQLLEHAVISAFTAEIAPGMRIALAEDDPVLALALRRQVIAAGHDVCGWATRAEDAAEMAAEHGPFPGYFRNREHMLRVMRNHRRAAYGVPRCATEGAARERVGVEETRARRLTATASDAQMAGLGAHAEVLLEQALELIDPQDRRLTRESGRVLPGVRLVRS
mgnify:CR=1 FL=1